MMGDLGDRLSDEMPILSELQPRIYITNWFIKKYRTIFFCCRSNKYGQHCQKIIF